MMSKRIFLGTLAVCILITGASLWFSRSTQQPGSPQSSEDAGLRLQPVDVKDLNAFVGAVDYVFVGKVLAQTGVVTDTYFGGAQGHSTVFKIQPIFNIKGNLSEPVEVRQSGVKVENSIHVLEAAGEGLNTRQYPTSQSLLLEIGHTYILMVPRNATQDYLYLPYKKEFRTELSANENATVENLHNMALQSSRVYDLLAAYVNEVPRRPNILNRFDLLSESDKKIVFDKFAELVPAQDVPQITHPEPYDFSPPAVENDILYCIDGIDNDKDGYIDIQDSECKPLFKENNAGLCRDTRDDDFDGLIDAADPDCAPFYPQQTQTPPPSQPNPPVISSSTSSTSP